MTSVLAGSGANLYDNTFEMRGRVAYLNQDIKIHTSISNTEQNSRKIKKGSRIVLKFYQGVSDLYIFNIYSDENQFICTFPLRTDKFTWEDEMNVQGK